MRKTLLILAENISVPLRSIIILDCSHTLSNRRYSVLNVLRVFRSTLESIEIAGANLTLNETFIIF